MKKRIYNDEQPGVGHVALQAMAVTMAEYNYDTIRDIYQFNNLRLTPVESNARRWKDEGWTDSELKRYSWYGGIRVTVKAWSDIMHTIRPEQVEQLQKMPLMKGQTVSSNVRQFVAAFLAFVHGQPFEERVKRLVWPVIMKSDPKLVDIVFQMAHQPENAGFLKCVNPQILTLVYHSEYSEKWENMKPVENVEMLRDVFWENELLDEARRKMFRDCYLYNVEFLNTGKLQEVLSELPEKTEITIRVELSTEEQALYDNLRQQAIANLETGSKSVLQTLAEITRLRQAACHPRLIDPKLPIPSSKTQAFLDLVEELRQSGHRALVFSQFTSHLALIREALDQKFDPEGNLQSPDYLYLDGSTTPGERTRLVQRFQTGNQPLFLISLKAGGLGLNLTAADYVIHLDPWWNPAIEDQASDRTHRIGQERPVTVYRLISAGTIEEKIIRLHQNKRSMADALLQDADMFAQISADDVIRLLRESVEEIGMKKPSF